MEAEASAVFNRVAAVIEHAVESLVQMRHVISAVEIIIDKDLPIAVQAVRAALNPMQILKSQVGDLRAKVVPDKFREGRA